MAEVLDCGELMSEPLGWLLVLVLAIVGWLVGSMPKPAAARPTIALASPRLVALDSADAASATRLLGSLAAEVLADPQ